MYIESAKQVGEFIGQRNLSLIYGGGKVGLMGAVADASIDAGGKVIGIIPDFMMAKEIGHTGLSELVVVESMHERKLQMHELSDAVITLPGGFGTFEELFEILTWIQLGLYQKPVGILNINGYYDFLEKQLDNMVVEGLLKKEHREGLVFSNDLEELFELMHQYKPIEQLFQLKKDET
ncbi:MAG: TIGR00730 family Rossman fold protein [Crocinitomicaceae bacterium]|nr:TIGR00730 family Rossman fold protein [Crocinitomicaceae bacterium]